MTRIGNSTAITHTLEKKKVLKTTCTFALINFHSRDGKKKKKRPDKCVKI